MITRNNYEEYFLLYVDNELSAPGRNAVDAFVRENPDLKEELTRLKQAVLKPENAIVFANKESLLKQAGDICIDKNNYEEYFLLYLDNELDAAAKKEVELFASQSPSLLEELNLLLQTRLEPDTAIVFEGKEILYKEEKEEKVIVFPWFRVAAAAAVVLLLAGFFVYNYSKPVTQSIADDGKKNTKAEVRNTKEETKKTEPGVTSATTASLDKTDDSKKQMTAETKTSRPLLPSITKENKTKNADHKNDPAIDTENNDELASTITVAKVIDPKITNAEVSMTGSSLNTAPNNLIAKAETTVGEATAVKAEPNYVQLALQKENSSTTDDGFYATNAPEKKNKLRGLFRKVSRVFDKNANADDDNKHGILIGGFSIALK
jgi:hypothetical protein